MRSKHIAAAIILVTAIAVILSSCSSLPVPEELMRPPIGEDTVKLDFNPDAYIPSGLELLTPSNSGGRYRINYIDIENDGINELLLYFGNPEELKCTGFKILNKYQNWYTSYEEIYGRNDRYNVESVEFEDITGSGSREMIVELSTFNGARVFTLRMFTPEPVRMCMFGADRVDVIKSENSNSMLAIWNYGAGGFDIDVIRWENDGFVNAAYDAPGYFANLIPSFEKAAESEDNGLLYLADVLLKAGDYKRSLEAVSGFLKEERKNELTLKALVIKARCMFNLGETDKLSDVLSDAELIQGYDPDLLLEAYLLIVDILISKGFAEDAEKTNKNAEKLLYNYMRGDYKLHLWTEEIENRYDRIEAENGL